jgi:hypothetical protein
VRTTVVRSRMTVLSRNDVKGVLERFSNSREASGNVQGGFFLGKKPLIGCAFPLHQLENRYTAERQGTCAAVTNGIRRSTE